MENRPAPEDQSPHGGTPANTPPDVPPQPPMLTPGYPPAPFEAQPTPFSTAPPPLYPAPPGSYPPQYPSQPVPWGYPPTGPYAPGMPPPYPSAPLPEGYTVPNLPPYTGPPPGAMPQQWAPGTGGMMPPRVSAPRRQGGPLVAVILSALIILTLIGVLVAVTTIQNHERDIANQNATATVQTQDDQATQTAIQQAQATASAQQTMVAAATATQQALERGYATRAPGCSNDGGTWGVGSYTVTHCVAGGLQIADTSSRYVAVEFYRGDMGYFPTRYDMHVTVNMAGSSYQQYSGLLLRFAPGAYAYAALFLDNSGDWQMDSYNNSGQPHIITNGNIGSITSAILDARPDGTTVSFTINGALVGSLPDGNVGSVPAIGLTVASGSGSAIFSDFGITTVT